MSFLRSLAPVKRSARNARPRLPSLQLQKDAGQSKRTLVSWTSLHALYSGRHIAYPLNRRTKSKAKKNQYFILWTTNILTKQTNKGARFYYNRTFYVA